MFSTCQETMQLIQENPARDVYVKAGLLGWAKIDREAFLVSLEDIAYLQTGNYHTRLIIDIIFVEKIS